MRKCKVEKKVVATGEKICYNTPCVRVRVHYIGMSPSGKAPDFDSGIRRFKSGHPSQSEPLAQSVEQLPFKQWVRGSNPRRVTRNKPTPNGVGLFLFFCGTGFGSLVGTFRFGIGSGELGMWCRRDLREAVPHILGRAFPPVGGGRMLRFHIGFGKFGIDNRRDRCYSIFNN